MKTYSNVLNSDTIKAIRDETNKSFQEDVWRLSTLCWPSYIKVGIMAGAACKALSSELASEVEAQIKHLLPPYETLIQQIYVWPPTSGISAHNDGNKKFGVTIYLNDHWELNFGGLFIWRDKDTDELKVRMPEFNSMVLNDEEELHLVTPVANGCSVLRHTIQIWGM